MEIINLADVERLAATRVERAAWDYVQGGSGDEVTLRANRDAFDRLRLRPSVLRGVTECDLSTSVLGTPVRAPIMVAPMGYHALVHPDGECATARGAAAAGAVMAVSTMASTTLEDVAAAAGAPLWFQLYVFRDRALVTSLVRRAERAGYRALMVTVDVPRLGARERDLRNGFALPPTVRAANLTGEHAAGLWQSTTGASAIATHVAAEFDSALTWDVIAWLRAQTTMPLVLKGILTREDAAQAALCGVDAIVVSNHGGRQLDGASASIEALPEVLEGARGRCEVFVDGGVRRGTDVLKALALGARGVFVGRPVLWGLAAGGADGVRRVLDVLRDELALAMLLCGRRALGEIDATLVTRA